MPATKSKGERRESATKQKGFRGGPPQNKKGRGRVRHKIKGEREGPPQNKRGEEGPPQNKRVERGVGRHKTKVLSGEGGGRGEGLVLSS